MIARNAEKKPNMNAVIIEDDSPSGRTLHGDKGDEYPDDSQRDRHFRLIPDSVHLAAIRGQSKFGWGAVPRSCGGERGFEGRLRGQTSAAESRRWNVWGSSRAASPVMP